MKSIAGLRLLLTGALLMGLPGRVGAQTATLSGRLSDAGTRQPIASAAVQLAGTRFDAITDPLGFFRISEIPAGRYLLQVTHVAYGTQRDSIVLGPGANQAIALRISPRAITLEPVEVEALIRTRPEAARSGVITRAQIEQMIGRARNIGELVRAYVPGASVSERRGGLICLEFRAARGSRTSGCNFPKVVVDDVPVPSPAYFLRDTPIADLDRVEFIPASEGAARYGVDSQYGVLVITTRRSSVSAAPAPRPATPSSYPAYQWQNEPTRYPWPRAFAASTAGNVAGVALGLAVLGCFPIGDGYSSNCVEQQGTGAGLAALALPAIGAVAGARLFGTTDFSAGRTLPGLVATALPLMLGYAMYVDGERSGISSSRGIGTVLIVAGAPIAATLADVLFRKRRLN